MSDEVSRAKARALRLLAVRARSSREMEERLKRLGFGPETVATTLGWLKSLGYLDDAAFARSFVSYRLRGRPVGRKRILYDLMQRGIERSAAEEAFDAALEWEGAESEVERALLAVQSRLATSGGPLDEKVVGRIVRFLRGRGFTDETIRKTLSRLRAGM